MNAKQQVSVLQNKLSELKYYVEEDIARKIFLAMNYKGAGISTILLEGPAGTGKTSLVESLASIYNTKLEIYQAVPTTGEEQLLYDLNLKGIIEKDSKNIIRMGKLLKTLIISRQQRIFLLLDEWDKARAEADSYLLDFLQNGRLTGTPYGDLQTKGFNNIVVFIAKNDERDLSEPLIRRCRRIVLPIPKPEIVRKSLISITTQNTDPLMIQYLVNIYKKQYENQREFRKIVTIQELKNALYDDMSIAEYEDEIRLENIIDCWIIKYDEDYNPLMKLIKGILFRYPKSVYDDLGLISSDNIFDVKTIMTIITKKLITSYNKKNNSQIILWSSLWYIKQLENYNDFQKKIKINDIVTLIKCDRELEIPEKRAYNFIKDYNGKDLELAKELVLGIPFIDDKGSKINLNSEKLNSFIRG